MSNPNEFIYTSLDELNAIKNRLVVLDKMAVTASIYSLWHVLAAVRKEEAELNELRKAYFFYE
ncbi:hypothetical protein BELINDA_200 [Bacillus phage Belinda]|uniref:hypothetical protein n=1 Tax=Bacillus phage Belinda TaxID=1852564 RepID=UPI0007F04F8E|nr:hypothetical protein BI039_gp178 [Bacillus phage Belinda]ANM46126.1 hypothetical protein BELINDA_200 [Bacillus phage Belinda]